VKIAIMKSGPIGGGGVSRVVESWSRILGENGHTTVVLSQDGPGGRRLPEMTGVTSRLYRPEPARGRWGRAREIERAACRTLGDLQSASPVDLVIAHSSRLTVAVHRHFPHVRLLQTIHSPSVEENRLNNWKYTRVRWRRLTYPATRILLWRLDREALRSVSCAHTLSEFTWKLISAHYPAVCRRTKWVKIQGTYDHRRFVEPDDRAAVRTALGFRPDELVLLTVRRLVPRNGVDRILDCALGLPGGRATFLIGGTGPLAAELQRRIDGEGLGDRVRLLGFIREEDLAAYYQAADAFLLPTRDLEGFGLPVIEAMGSGCTPLVTPVGGAAEVCHDWPEYTARENSTPAFVELVRQFVAGEIPRRNPALAEAARRRYSESSVRPAVLRLVDELA
jgi:glycosyltransferase involved in cell wall biosynthesis